MKKYSVTYNTTTSFEAIVEAKNKKEAEAKVVEVIGEPVEVETVREVY